MPRLLLSATVHRLTLATASSTPGPDAAYESQLKSPASGDARQILAALERGMVEAEETSGLSRCGRWTLGKGPPLLWKRR